MKVLWVKGGGLVPPDVGGKIRSYHLLRELAKRHRITLFTFYAAHPNDQHKRLETVLDRVVCVPLDIPPRRSIREYVSVLRQIVSPIPYSIAKYCRPEVGRALRALVAKENYDVVVCDFILPAAVLPWELATPKIIFTHNVETLIWKRHTEIAKNPFWKLITWREYRTMENYEKRNLSRADHVLTVSQVDRAFFSDLIPASKITVVPTGVDLDYFAPTEQKERPESLVFSGSMDWIPNEDGILFFIEEVLPLVRSKVTGATLTIVGRNPSEKLRSIARQSGVEVTGTVADIRPHVAPCAVYIVPLRVGSGTRLKIFEAMAMGKAIVSTTLGAEGLPVKHGENILLADTPEDFAARIIELIGDAAARARLGANARQLVAQRYSWAAASRVFDDVFAALVNGQPLPCIAEDIGDEAGNS